MMRKEILDAAQQIVCTDRNEQYGEPEDNFAVIAALWTTLVKAHCVGGDTDVRIDAADVGVMMALFKIARIATSADAKADNYIDLAGYAACAGEIATKREDNDG